MKIFKRLASWADRSAIFLSSLCVVHCLVLPVVLIILPTLSSLAYFSDERFHVWMLFGVIPISVFALAFGYLHHKSYRVVAVASMGIMILLLATLFGHDALGHTGEIIASVIGSLFIAFAHIQNLRQRQMRCAS